MPKSREKIIEEIAALHKRIDRILEESSGRGAGVNRTEDLTAPMNAAGILGVTLCFVLYGAALFLPIGELFGWLAFVLAVCASMVAFGPSLVTHGGRQVNSADMSIALLLLAAGGVSQFYALIKGCPTNANALTHVAVVIIIFAVAGCISAKERPPKVRKFLRAIAASIICGAAITMWIAHVAYDGAAYAAGMSCSDNPSLKKSLWELRAAS